MAETFPFIDYTDMIEDINDDLESGFIKEDSMLFVVRQQTPVYVEAWSREAFPVIDYFYDYPDLLEDIRTMTVEEAKKICFTALEALAQSDAEASVKESLKASAELLIRDLKEYTAGNNKRNNRPCKVVFEKEHLVPMMVYYDDNDAADMVEMIKAGDLLTELKACSEN